MHTRSSNSKLVEPYLKPVCTLNRRPSSIEMGESIRHEGYKRPGTTKSCLPTILDINNFHHFLDILENYNPIDDEPMWAADCVIAPTLGSTITIPETANELAIKETPNEAIRLMMFPLSLTGEEKTWLDELNEGTIKMWDKLSPAVDLVVLVCQLNINLKLDNQLIDPTRQHITYEWDEEDVLSDDNEMVEVKVLMALSDDENVVVGKESARNDE
ncbi:hypothetical protein Tco_0760952 [Tanacetum coccineum]